MTLSRGARRCFETLQSFLKGKDHCWPGQAKIAERMGCSLRSVKTYLEELRQIGAITSKRRPNSSCMYTIELGFALPKMGVALPVALPEVQICTSTISSLTEEKHETQSESVCRDTVNEPPSFSHAEAEAIQRHVRATGHEPDARLMGELQRKAQHFRRNGFQIAAAIERGWRKVQGGSNAPRSLGWFVRCVENEFLSGAASGRQVEQLGVVKCAPNHSGPSQETSCLPLAEGDRESVSGEVATIPAPPMSPCEVQVHIRIPPQRAEELTSFSSAFATAIEGLARAKTMGRRA